MQDLEYQLDLLERALLGRLAKIFPFLIRKLERGRVRGADLGKHGTMEKLDEAASEHAQVMAALISLFDESERFEWLAREDAADDPEKRLVLDQAHAIAHGLSADLVARKRDDLVEERHGVAHAAFGRARDQSQCS